MSRLLPGTRALRTFEAAARHLNFTRAADEIGLTPAAVSYQIKEIEEQLGIILFSRTSRTIRLTDAGAILFNATTEALDGLDRAVLKARRLARGAGTLRITIEPTFCTRWLLPRLPRFRAKHPEIELTFDITDAVRNFELDDIDVALRFGLGQYPGTRVERLFETLVIPVCSPALLASGPPLREPRDLFHHTLCEIDWSLQGVTWPTWHMWMAAAGIEDFDDSRCVVFDDSAHAVQAAIQGDAVALAEFAIVANDLSQGRLVRPFELGIRIAPEFAYYLVCPENLAEDVRVTAFRAWVMEEAAGTSSASEAARRSSSSLRHPPDRG